MFTNKETERLFNEKFNMEEYNEFKRELDEFMQRAERYVIEAIGPFAGIRALISRKISRDPKVKTLVNLTEIIDSVSYMKSTTNTARKLRKHNLYLSKVDNDNYYISIIKPPLKMMSLRTSIAEKYAIILEKVARESGISYDYICELFESSTISRRITYQLKLIIELGLIESNDAYLLLCGFSFASGVWFNSIWVEELESFGFKITVDEPEYETRQSSPALCLGK